MAVVKIVPMPGPSGNGGSANTGNFVFDGNHVSTNEDMTIGVNGVPGSINLSAYLGVDLNFAEAPGAGLRFPDGTVQTTAFVEQVTSPLPDFLTYVEGREALPHININFGWDSNGVWFGPTAVDSQSNPSYPVFTDFILNTTDKVFVSFNVNIEETCSDVGICVFPDGIVPNWTWGSDDTRIAAQFNCPSMEIHGTTISTSGSPSVPAPGEYRIEFTYDPNLEIDNTKFEYFAINDSVAIGSMTLSQVLPSGNYRIGFASDNDINEEGVDSALNRTYISQLSIMVNDGQTTYFNTLKTGYSGASNILDLTVPVNILDTDGNNFITFTKTGTGTARIATPQDDLSLRSARDITLYPGSDGPGNVYIGWGDAVYTPDSPNRVATIGDLNTNTKTWTAPNTNQYRIYQAHGADEIVLNEYYLHTATDNYVETNFINTTSIDMAVNMDTESILFQVYGGSRFSRYISFNINGVDHIVQNMYPQGPLRWHFDFASPVSLYTENQYTININLDGDPIKWWDAATVSEYLSENVSDFRGAKIDYHAYDQNAGTIIGSMYIADDSGNGNITHMETTSGSTNISQTNLWYRKRGSSEEGKVYAFNEVGNMTTIRIHWTAQVYYSPEYYD